MFLNFLHFYFKMESDDVIRDYFIKNSVFTGWNMLRRVGIYKSQVN